LNEFAVFQKESCRDGLGWEWLQRSNTWIHQGRLCWEWSLWNAAFEHRFVSAL